MISSVSKRIAVLVAGMASTDFRTVLRHLEGKPVRPLSRERIEQVLTQHPELRNGTLPEGLLAPAVGGEREAL